MQAESIAKASQHSKIVGAFKQTYWPEGVTQDGDMAQYVDALAQLFSMRKIREAQARGVNVEEAVNNGNIEVVNDGKTVKVVLRHNAQAQTQTQAQTEEAPTVQTETAPTAETTETSEVSARERERQKKDIDEADVIAEFEQDKPYEAKLAEEDRAWDTVIDIIDPPQPVKGPTLSKDHPNFTVLRHMPLVLQGLKDSKGNIIEIKDQPLEIEALKLSKATEDYKKLKQRLEKDPPDPQRKHRHEIDPQKLRGLPSKLANPLMVFRTQAEGRDSFTLAIEMEDGRGANVIVPIEIVDVGGKYIVKTIYGRLDNELRYPNFKYFYNMIKSKRTAYVDQIREATQDLLAKVISDAPKETRSALYKEIELLLNDPNIKQKSDLDKQRAQYNFEFYQDARGKTTFTPEETIISVFEGGDKSTMIHELGHVFLQELAQFAKMNGADPMFADEWAVVSKWLKVEDLDPNDLKTEEEQNRWHDAQEQFAASFEAYLMEGNAPTPELQSVFRRFKAWLANVYNTVKNIAWKDSQGNIHHVEINDEIRGFFDRLFASRQAIEEQQAISRAEESMQAFVSALEKAGASAGSIEIVDSGGKYIVKTIFGRLDKDLRYANYSYFYDMIVKSKATAYVDQTREATQDLLAKVISDAPKETRSALYKEIELLLNDPNIKQKSDLDKQRAQYNFEVYQDARGKTTFASEETIISVFEGGDKSTMIHELGHVFLQELAQFAKMNGADPMFADEWAAVSKWLKIEDLLRFYS